MAKRKKVLSRADFLGRLKRELVDLPELGGAVWLRELATRQKLEFNDHLQDLQKDHPELRPVDSIDLMARLVSMSACDEDGTLLFTADDVQALAETNPSALLTLSAKAMDLSGLGSAAIEEVKDQLKKATSGDSVTT